MLMLSVLVMCFGVALRLSWEAMKAPETAYAQQADCSVVEEFEGNGDTTTPPFDISGERFLVNYTAVNTGPPEVPGVLGVIVRDANDNQVGNARLDGEGSNTLSIDEGPGQFTIEVISAEVDYTISVEDCEGSGQGPPAPDPQPSPNPQPIPNPDPQPKPSPTPRQPDPGNGDLMNAGGPKAGPVPVMPNGECPKEFPVKRSGACYS